MQFEGVGKRKWLYYLRLLRPPIHVFERTWPHRHARHKAGHNDKDNEFEPYPPLDRGAPLNPLSAVGNPIAVADA